MMKKIAAVFCENSFESTRMINASQTEEIDPLVEPNYFEIAFPHYEFEELHVENDALLRELPLFRKEKIENSIEEFERFLLDERYLSALVSGLRAVADDVVVLCSNILKIYHYNKKAQKLLAHFAKEEY